MNKYNVLIIGAGGQGSEADQPGSGNEHKIISYAHAFKEHPGFETITFYDKDKLKSKAAAEIWDCYYSECDIDYICKYGNIDIAIISTPDETHYEILKQIIDCPLKLVICEKPICADLQQAKGIIELYKEKNIPLMVNYTRRFLPYYQELKKFYDMGLFGEVKNCTLNFNRGWEHTATHGIDLFNWFFGDKIKTDIRYCGHDNYRVWSISMEFEKYFWHEERIYNQKVWDYYNFSHWYIAENAFNYLEGEEPLRCTGEDALKALEICYELMEGAK